jgi:hypothetical protein
MIKSFSYKKENGVVCHVSNGLIYAPSLEQTLIDITGDDLRKIESNKYELRIADGKLTMEKKKEAIKKEAQETLLAKIESGSFTLADLKPFLKELLTQ